MLAETFGLGDLTAILPLCTVTRPTGWGLKQCAQRHKTAEGSKGVSFLAPRMDTAFS
jgi:hypothetical protein